MEPAHPDGRVAGFRAGHGRAHDRLLEFCTCGVCTCGTISRGTVAGHGRAVLLPGQRSALAVRDTGCCPRPAEAGLLPAGRREALGQPGQLRLASVRQHRT
jgi:hypothetical protein